MGVLNMILCRYFLCFAVFSFIGWVWECVYYTIQQKRLVNSGFLSTCFCPIYGIGALLDLIILGRIKNPVWLFIAGMVVTGTLEYFVSWFFEKLFHQRWWDYTNWPLNINGRICILSILAFGVFTVALIKYIAPFTMGMIDMFDPFVIQVSAVIIAIVMIADTIMSIKYMDVEKLWYVDKQSEFFENLAQSRCGSVVRKIKDTLRR